MYCVIIPRPRPKADWEMQDDPFRPSLTVETAEPEKTGLLDKDGNPVYRVTERIGFIRG